MSSEASKYFQHSFIRLCISIIYKNQQEGVEINKYSPTNEFSENPVQILFQNNFFRKLKNFFTNVSLCLLPSFPVKNMSFR